MEDHRAVVPEQASAGVVVGRAGVDDDGFAGVGRERELGVEELLLRRRRRVVAEVVETGLADRDRARVREQLLQLVERSEVEARGLVRVDAEDAMDVVGRLGARQRPPGACEARRDVDHPA